MHQNSILWTTEQTLAGSKKKLLNLNFHDTINLTYIGRLQLTHPGQETSCKVIMLSLRKAEKENELKSSISNLDIL